MDTATSITFAELLLAMGATAIVAAVATAMVAHVRGRDVTELYAYVQKWASLDDDMAAAALVGMPDRHLRLFGPTVRVPARHRAAER
ncbi:hypothetical protein [Hamadaea tsunoensis]|uniref:hypothetical protein n=1 Tax=Hamadaea tsunoensis TaxID=53368 RepID=UPI00041EB449|nr:hypothetical protein [Hamadaea tsunoensis]